jgi:signal transduction histidine kinase
MTNNPLPEIKAAIVIIDDDRSIIDLTSRVLSQHGYNVYSTTSAVEGMDIIASKNPELVLLDYMMPEMDGLTALREIRTRFPSTYVVIFTGMGNEEIAVELMKAGASEYILKPFNNRNLVERIDNTLHIREIELQNKALQLEHDRLLKQIDTWAQELQHRIREKTEALQKAQSEIAQSEKVAALGYLSAGIAHEIRNPLNSISLFAQLMRQNASDPEQIGYLGKIIKEIDRADAIIHKLLGASRLTRTTTRNVLINQVIDTALEAFAPQIEIGKILVIRNFHSVPPPIKADPAELEQIFTNLFLNALDEMPGGGRLEIEIRVENGMVVVRVEDSGQGISDQVLPNIFEPFFTTKARGSGMGLPVVKRIARIYGGSIAVEKTSPDGTVFRLEFPPAATQADN